jgi:hypothetical protein
VFFQELRPEIAHGAEACEEREGRTKLLVRNTNILLFFESK